MLDTFKNRAGMVNATLMPWLSTQIRHCPGASNHQQAVADDGRMVAVLIPRVSFAERRAGDPGPAEPIHDAEQPS